MQSLAKNFYCAWKGMHIFSIKLNFLILMKSEIRSLFASLLCLNEEFKIC